MAGAIDWVLTFQQADAAKETSEEGKKRAHRRYADSVVALSKAFALAASSDLGHTIRDEVGFFQAIRAALIKSVPGDGKKSAAEGRTDNDGRPHAPGPRARTPATSSSVWRQDTVGKAMPVACRDQGAAGCTVARKDRGDPGGERNGITSMAATPLR